MFPDVVQKYGCYASTGVLGATNGLLVHIANWNDSDLYKPIYVAWHCIRKNDWFAE